MTNEQIEGHADILASAIETTGRNTARELHAVVGELRLIRLCLERLVSSTQYSGDAAPPPAFSAQSADDYYKIRAAARNGSGVSP